MSGGTEHQLEMWGYCPMNSSRFHLWEEDLFHSASKRSLCGFVGAVFDFGLNHGSFIFCSFGRKPLRIPNIMVLYTSHNQCLISVNVHRFDNVLTFVDSVDVGIIRLSRSTMRIFAMFCNLQECSDWTTEIVRLHCKPNFTQHSENNGNI